MDTSSPVRRRRPDYRAVLGMQTRSETLAARRGQHHTSHWVGSGLLLLGSLIALFIAGEGAAFFAVPKPIVWRYPQEGYVRDEVLGHRLKPNQVAFTHAAEVRTNSRGLRDAELTPTPLPGVTRILCLGDSLTFGNGVELRETYPKQLEALLNGAGVSRRYEVINAGVPAYDTWQELAYFRRDGLALAPDLVVLGFYANDIVPRPRTVGEPPAGEPAAGALEEARARPALAERTVYLLKRSRLLLLARQRLAALRDRWWPSPPAAHERALLAGTRDDFVEAGFREVDRAFDELDRLRRVHGFDVLVVVFPMAEQVAARHPRAAYPSRVREIARRHGLPVIDLMPDFEAAFAGFGSLFIEWDGHPNGRAYGIAARRIHEFVVARGGIDVARTGAVSR